MLPANQELDLSNVISVSIQAVPVGLSLPNVNTCAFVTTEQPSGWAVGQSYAVYTSPGPVGTDFGLSSSMYAMAVKFFSQTPNPLLTQGYLVIVPRLPSAHAALQVEDITYTAVASGSGGNSITIAYTTGGTAGAEVVTVVGPAISVQIQSGVSSPQQIMAAVLASGPATALVTPAITGTGTAETAPFGPTNLAGGGAETSQAAVARTVNSVFYFGVILDEEMRSQPAAFAALVAYLQSINKMLFYTSSNIADLAPGSILDLVRQASEPLGRCLYYGNPLLDGDGDQQTQMFSAAYAGRALSTDFSGSLTASTMHLKQLVGITPDQTINQTYLLQAGAAGVDLYVSISGFACVFTSGANEFFDQAYARTWFKFALEIAGFNYLAGTSTKIPQTEEGMTGLKDAYAQVCKQAVANGYLAPGNWYSATTFGNPVDLKRNVGDYGYYIFSTPVAQQSPADRIARKAPLIQIAAQEAGAVQQSSVLVNVEA